MTKRTADKNDRTRPIRRRFFSRLKRFLISIIVLLFLAGLIAQNWVIPKILHSQVSAAVSDYWLGNAQIGSIEFSFYKPTVLRQITLTDEQGNRWLEVKSISLMLDNWPGTHPVLKKIEIDQPSVKCFLQDGKCTLPLRKNLKRNQSESVNQNLNDYFDLQQLRVHELDVAVLEKNEVQNRLSDFEFSAVKKGELFTLLLTRLSDDGEDNLLLGGSVNPQSLQTKLSLQLGCVVGDKSIAGLLKLWKNSFVRAASGNVMADVTFTGKLDEPDSYYCRGLVTLNGWQVELFDDLRISDLDSNVWIEGRRISFDHIVSTCCDGDVSGDMFLRVERNQPVSYGGSLAATSIDLNKLTNGILALPQIEQGRGSAKYNFTMQGSEFDNLQGLGLFMLDDAHLWNLPVILQLFNQFKITRSDPMGISDVAALFYMKGPEMTFERAVLANAISAIEMDRGGKINLENRQVDLYVVGVPLRVLRKFVSAIPIVRLIVPLRDRLTHLHLIGSWNDSSRDLIFKEPFKRLSDATRNFLQKTAETDGQFDAETVKMFRETFDGLLNANSSFLNMSY